LLIVKLNRSYLSRERHEKWKTKDKGRAADVRPSSFINGDSGFCSGWLHSSRAISTAGHCVYDSNRGGWASKIKVTPGRNGPNPPFPFRTCDAIEFWSNSFWLGQAGTPAQRPYNDWGGVIVDCSYRQLGNFGFEISIPPTGQQAILSGYPCEGIASSDLGKQFSSTGTVQGVEGFLLGRNRIVKVNPDAVGCNSGSPIYKSNSSVYATTTKANSDVNRGVLISPEYYSAFVAAKNRSFIYVPMMKKP
jgi:V8-like Glu-specific endopeptidase